MHIVLFVHMSWIIGLRMPHHRLTTSTKHDWRHKSLPAQFHCSALPVFSAKTLRDKVQIFARHSLVFSWPTSLSGHYREELAFLRVSKFLACAPPCVFCLQGLVDETYPASFFRLALLAHTLQLFIVLEKLRAVNVFLHRVHT